MLFVFAVLFIVIAGFIVVFRFIRRPAGAKKDPGLNVLIITLDTTRADRLGCYGYPKAGTPNLDALAAGGVRFDNTTCQVPLTGPSHCSLFTGAYPFVHQVHNNGSRVLSPEIQTLMMREFFISPTNQKVVVPDDLKKAVPISGADMAKILTWDWDFVNKNQGEFAERWAKTFS